MKTGHCLLVCTCLICSVKLCFSWKTKAGARVPTDPSGTLHTRTCICQVPGPMVGVGDSTEVASASTAQRVLMIMIKTPRLKSHHILKPFSRVLPELSTFSGQQWRLSPRPHGHDLDPEGGPGNLSILIAGSGQPEQKHIGLTLIKAPGDKRSLSSLAADGGTEARSSVGWCEWSGAGLPWRLTW